MTKLEDVVFGIPSYRRSDKCTTPDALVAKGVRPSQIVIAVQNADDERLYGEKFAGRFRVIERDGACLSDNRNTLIRAANGKPMMMLDDDIRDFIFLSDLGGGKLRYHRMPNWVFRKFVETGFAIIGGRPRDKFGFRPTQNPLCAHRRITRDCLIEGTCQAFIASPEQMYDRRFIVKEDFEHSCRILSRGGHTYRFDDVASICSHFATDGTGCGAHFSRDAEMTAAVCRMYPKYLKPIATKPNVKFIPKTKKYGSFLSEAEMKKATAEAIAAKEAK